jgi:tetratricopeptide (TPR) repeat protein
MRLFILAICLCFTAGVFGQQMVPSPSQALQFMKEAKYTEAEVVWTTILKRNPRDLEALKERATCYIQLERYPESIQDHLQALKQVSSPDLFGQLGYVYLQNSDTKSARIYLEKAIASDSTDMSFVYNLGLSYQIDKEFDRAITYYNYVLKRFPDSQISMKGKARCLLALELYDQAGEVINSFFAAGYFHREMIGMRGDLRFHKEEYEKALADYSRAALSSMGDVYFYAKAALCLSQLHLYAEEVDLRKQILQFIVGPIQNNPERADAYMRLGLAQIQSGEFDDAEESINESLKQDDKLGLSYFYRSLIRVKSKNFEDGCLDLNKAKQLLPNESERFDGFYADDEFEEFMDYCNPNP